MGNVYFMEAGTHRHEDRILVYRNQQLLVRGKSITWRYHDISQLLDGSSPPVLIDTNSEVRYFGVSLGEDTTLPDEAELVPLRQVLLAAPGEDFRIPGLGNQLVNWLHSHRFCGVCGQATEPHAKERALHCGGCGQSWYPRINPCVIVLVVNGDRMLLAKHARYRLNMYTCLAGFIEAGETPEETVRREVREEAGIEVHNIRYIRSQSWPFPSQLMLGFFADYRSGDLVPDQDEIEELRWFGVDELPTYPSPGISVAGYLIDHFARTRAGTGE